MSHSLWPHVLQHARLFCPLLFPRVCSNSCPLSQCYYPTISSSVVPFSFCLPCFPSSGSFPMNQLFTSGGQSIRASALACLSYEYSGLVAFRIDCFDLLAVQVTLRSLLQHHNLKAPVLWCSPFLWFNSHIHTWLLGKKNNIALTIWTFVSKVISAFDTLSRFIIALIPRSKHLLMSLLQSPSSVILKS